MLKQLLGILCEIAVKFCEICAEKCSNRGNILHIFNSVEILMIILAEVSISIMYKKVYITPQLDNYVDLETC